MPEKLTTRAFVQRTREIHGKKYDYSRVDYQRIDCKVSIRCPIHGWFQQTPHLHFAGHGCPKCGAEKTKKVVRAAATAKKLQAAESFVTKAQSKHGNFYNYERVSYRGANIPVEIICPLHGSFFQQPIVHKTGHGCRKCGDKKSRQAKIKKDDWPTIEKIITHAIKKLGGGDSHHIPMLFDMAGGK